MSISIEKTKTGYHIEHESTPVSIYFDNWVFIDMFKNQSLKDEIVSLFLTKNATLLISITSFLEINNHLLKYNSEDEITKFLESLDTIDFGLIDMNIFDVLKREVEYINFKSFPHISSAAVPWDFLKEASKYYLINNSDDKHIKLSKINDLIFPGKHKLESIYDDLEYRFDNLKAKIIKCRNDNDCLDQSSRKFSNRNYTSNPSRPYTRYLWNSWIDFMVTDKERKIKFNDWIDLLHTIVPTSYCSMVLIDRSWREFIKQTGLTSPDIAKVYKKREFDHFMSDFKSL